MQPRSPRARRPAARPDRLAAAAILLGVLGHAPRALAQPAAPPATTAAEPPDAPEDDVIHERRSRSHVLGLRYDLGAAPTYGLAYLHGHDATTSRSGADVTTYFGYGIEGRLATEDHSRLDAGILSATARVGLWGRRGGLAAELLAGVGMGYDSVVPVGSIGVFWGFYLVEFGYSYQAPLASERPAWCSSHQLSVRLHIPLHVYAQREWDEPAPAR